MSTREITFENTVRNLADGTYDNNYRGLENMPEGMRFEINGSDFTLRWTQGTEVYLDGNLVRDTEARLNVNSEISIDRGQNILFSVGELIQDDDEEELFGQRGWQRYVPDLPPWLTRRRVLVALLGLAFILFLILRPNGNNEAEAPVAEVESAEVEVDAEETPVVTDAEPEVDAEETAPIEEVPVTADTEPETDTESDADAMAAPEPKAETTPVVAEVEVEEPGILCTWLGLWCPEIPEEPAVIAEHSILIEGGRRKLICKHGFNNQDEPGTVNSAYDVDTKYVNVAVGRIGNMVEKFEMYPVKVAADGSCLTADGTPFEFDERPGAYDSEWDWYKFDGKTEAKTGAKDAIRIRSTGPNPTNPA